MVREVFVHGLKVQVVHVLAHLEGPFCSNFAGPHNLFRIPRRRCFWWHRMFFQVFRAAVKDHGGRVTQLDDEVGGAHAGFFSGFKNFHAT